MTRRNWVLLTLLLDTALINLGYVLAFLARFGGELPEFNFSAYVSLIVPITVLQLAIFAAYELYDPERLDSPWEIFSRVFVSVSLGSVLTVFITFFFRQFSFPRLVLFIGWMLLIILVYGGRRAAANLLRIRWPARRVLVVGKGALADQVTRELEERKDWGYNVVGTVSERSDVPAMVASQGVDQIIITTPSRHRDLIDELVRKGVGSVRVDVIPELYEIYIGRPDHTLLSDLPLMAITGSPIPGWRRITKRTFDLVLALVLLPFLLVILPFAAIAIKLSAPGPVFYRQERAGRNQKRFMMLKFRTMVKEAEKLSGPVMAADADPRVTGFGRLLRRLRIDELPQIINVIRGEMSFVGPRPERPHFVEEFLRDIPGYVERFAVAPGMTGLAQISGHYATDAENKLRYDLIYVRHQSILLDVKVLLHTIRVVLRGREHN